MKSYEIVRAIMEAQHILHGKLADRLGMKPNALSMRLCGERDMTVDKLAETLRVMDYRLVAVPRESKLPKDSYEVE